MEPTVVAPIIMITVTCIVVITIIKTINKYKSIPTFDEYKSAHPELVKKGKVTCINCEGSYIYARLAGSFGTKDFNLHICRTCGTNLYRSEA